MSLRVGDDDVAVVCSMLAKSLCDDDDEDDTKTNGILKIYILLISYIVEINRPSIFIRWGSRSAIFSECSAGAKSLYYEIVCHFLTLAKRTQNGSWSVVT